MTLSARSHENFGRLCEVNVGGLRVESLRVGFTVEKTAKREPNTCEIAVYNLSRAHREALETGYGKVRVPGTKLKAIPVRLAAGYQGTGMSLLFYGQLREVFSRPESDGSWVTVLRSGDGDRATRARATFGFRPGVSIARVVESLAGEMGIGLGNAGKQLAVARLTGLGATIGRGATFEGAAPEQLDALLRSAGYEWSIQDNTLQVMPIGKSLDTQGVLLSPQSGLVDVPTTDEKGNLQARALLLPGLVPGRRVKVRSSTIRGVWRLEKVRYVGDTHGQDWVAELEGTPSPEVGG
jgi:hypothetical protein